MELFEKNMFRLGIHKEILAQCNTPSPSVDLDFFVCKAKYG